MDYETRKRLADIHEEVRGLKVGLVVQFMWVAFAVWLAALFIADKVDRAAGDRPTPHAEARP